MQTVETLESGALPALDLAGLPPLILWRLTEVKLEGALAQCTSEKGTTIVLPRARHSGQICRTELSQWPGIDKVTTGSARYGSGA